MKYQKMYMWYYKEYRCWLKNEGDCGRAMDPEESFNLCLSKDLSVPCRLGLAGQRLWYVEIGPNMVKLNLRMNERSMRLKINM